MYKWRRKGWTTGAEWFLRWKQAERFSSLEKMYLADALPQELRQLERKESYCHKMHKNSKPDENITILFISAIRSDTHSSFFLFTRALHESVLSILKSSKYHKVLQGSEIECESSKYLPKHLLADKWGFCKKVDRRSCLSLLLLLFFCCLSPLLPPLSSFHIILLLHTRSLESVSFCKCFHRHVLFYNVCIPWEIAPQACRQLATLNMLSLKNKKKGFKTSTHLTLSLALSFQWVSRAERKF